MPSLSLLQVIPIDDRIYNVVEQGPNVAAAIVGSYAAVDFVRLGLRAGPNEVEQLAPPRTLGQAFRTCGIELTIRARLLQRHQRILGAGSISGCLSVNLARLTTRQTFEN